MSAIDTFYALSILGLMLVCMVLGFQSMHAANVHDSVEMFALVAILGHCGNGAVHNGGRKP